MSAQEKIGSEPAYPWGQDGVVAGGLTKRELIAAAPDLLEALIQANALLELIGRISPTDAPHDGSVGQIVRAAIAKALGVQP